MVATAAPTTKLDGIQIAVLYDVTYAHLPIPQRLDVIRALTGYTISGIRGLASRWRNRPEGMTAILQARTRNNAFAQSPARREIDARIERDRQAIQAHRDALKASAPGSTFYAVFISDVHLPTPDWRALQIVHSILQDLQPVAWISGLNDLYNFDQVSRYDDNRNVRDRAHEVDLSSAYALGHQLTDDLQRSAGATARVVAVTGNHDYRVARHNGDIQDGLVRDMMQAHDNILFPVAPERENNVWVNDGLVWTHGYHATMSVKSNSEKNYAAAKRSLRTKRDFTLVAGHSHRQYDYTIRTGGRFVNAGHLADVSAMHYLKGIPDWQLGIVVSEFDPHSDWHHTQAIPFTDDGAGGLLAVFNGRKYRARQVF